MVREVRWPSAAQHQLLKVYAHILKDSFQNAEKVKKEILVSTASLASHPEAHPLDKYRINNDGSFRAYEIYRYRISYRVTEKEIIVVRVRHTSMEPRIY
jgi:plasmid stabilization system protein ParE